MKTIQTKILVISILFSAAIPRVLFSAEKQNKLIFATKLGKLETVRSLLESNVDVEDEEGGMTALMVASSRGYCPVVKLLFEHNADVYKKNHKKTVLEYALDHIPDPETVKALLDAKADPNGKGHRGSPLEICQDRMSRYLEKKRDSDQLRKFTEVLALFYESEAAVTEQEP